MYFIETRDNTFIQSFYKNSLTLFHSGKGIYARVKKLEFYKDTKILLVKILQFYSSKGLSYRCAPTTKGIEQEDNHLP